MGGCRCIFQGCGNNSTHNPDMHFFHFPVKDDRKMKLWVKYARVEEILKLDKSKAANKVVCSAHFRDECFMNYKRNRIVKNSIPSLIVLHEDENGKIVYDYAESDNPVPTRIPPTTAKHLLPPNHDHNSLKRKADDKVAEDPNTKLQKVQKEIIFLNYENKKTSAVKISVIEPDPLSDPMTKTTDYDFEIEKCNNEAEDEDNIENSADENLDTAVVYHKFEEVKEPEQEINNILTEQFEEETPDKVDYKEVNEEEIINEKLTIEKIRNEMEALEKVKNEMAMKIKSFQQLLELKELELEKLKTQISKPSPKVNRITAPTALSKDNLFQSIKKYLCPSMSSLVCMEMFGNPERLWKEDEKEVATELLQLGEEVFCYFRDEWRFRLPPQKDVQEWLEEKNKLFEI